MFRCHMGQFAPNRAPLGFPPPPRLQTQVSAREWRINGGQSQKKRPFKDLFLSENDTFRRVPSLLGLVCPEAADQRTMIRSVRRNGIPSWSSPVERTRYGPAATSAFQVQLLEAERATVLPRMSRISISQLETSLTF